MLVGFAGLLDGPAFQLLDLDPGRATASRIKDTSAEVVLVDEADCPEEMIDLIRSIKEDSEELAVVCLVIQMEGDYLRARLRRARAA